MRRFFGDRPAAAGAEAGAIRVDLMDLSEVDSARGCSSAFRFDPATGWECVGTEEMWIAREAGVIGAESCPSTKCDGLEDRAISFDDTLVFLADEENKAGSTFSKSTSSNPSGA